MKQKPWEAEIKVSSGWGGKYENWSYCIETDTLYIYPRDSQKEQNKVYKTREYARAAARRAMKRLALVERAK